MLSLEEVPFQTFKSQFESKWGIVFIFIYFSLLNCNTLIANSQNEEIQDKFWCILEEKVSSFNPSTSGDELILLIKGKCQNDYTCLYSSYDKCRNLFELKFQLNHSISMSQEMLKLAQAEKNIEDEGNARMELSRFYSALGESKLHMDNLQKASICFKKTGNKSAEYLSQYYHLESSMEFRDPLKVIEEMDEVLAKVNQLNDTHLVTNLNMRMLEIKKTFKPSESKIHIRNLENIAEKNPNTKLAADIYLTTHQHRGHKAMGKGEFDTAIFHYSEALLLCQSISSKWQEIYSMQLLCNAMIQKGEINVALDKLEVAEEKAQRIEVNDLLAKIYKLKNEAFEKLGQYENALTSLKKHYDHKTLFDKRGEGFSSEKYYLQREKDVLSAGLKNQELENELQNARMKFLSVLMTLAMITVFFFIYIYKREQKSKSDLAKQNIFIKNQSERLKELDKVKSRFFANVSHELRTPLTLILGPIKKLLSDTTLKSDQSKLINMVDEASKQLDHLVKDILDLSNLELGKLEINKSEVFLNSYLKNYFNKFNELAVSKKIDYSIEINIDENLKAQIDKQKTKQLINNILSNAFKYTSKGGHVSVETIVYNEQLEITISDTGYGIPKQDLPHLFERYFQTNNDTKPAVGGFGIGLALCKEIIDVLGGKISVDSDVGVGSSFHLIWPIDSFLAKSDKDSITQSSNIRINEDNHKVDKVFENSKSIAKFKQKLLIVEDNIKLFEYMNLILQKTYDIHHAENGMWALEYISKNQVDLIISDLMMPVMDGYGLLEKLKDDKHYSQIPVIMVTAKYDKNDKIRALRMGVDDYIVKPFEEYELIRSVEKLLKNKAVRVSVIESVNSDEIDDQDQDWLLHLEGFVDNNLNNNLMNVAFVATNLAISESSLLRKTKRIIGLTPHAYIKERRLQAARVFFEEDNNKTIQEVAFAVGYLDARTLSRNFKSRFGKLPSNFNNETIASDN